MNNATRITVSTFGALAEPAALVAGGLYLILRTLGPGRRPNPRG